jgi:hypothetical protein
MCKTRVPPVTGSLTCLNVKACSSIVASGALAVVAVGSMLLLYALLVFDCPVGV